MNFLFFLASSSLITKLALLHVFKITFWGSHLKPTFLQDDFPYSSSEWFSHRGFKLHIHQIEQFLNSHEEYFKKRRCTKIRWCFFEPKNPIFLRYNTEKYFFYIKIMCGYICTPCILKYKKSSQKQFFSVLELTKNSSANDIFLLDWQDFIQMVGFPLFLQHACSLPAACTGLKFIYRL